MAQATLARMLVSEERAFAERIAPVLSRAIFGCLLALIVFTAIPYGTVEPWWKAVFVAFIFVLAIGWIVEGLLSGSWRTGGRAILLPPILLVIFSLAQTISFRNANGGGVATQLSAISADPYQTRFFVLQLLALITSFALFCRYSNSKRRIITLIYVILAVAVASAMFGIIRQTTQHQVGFGLPLIKPDQGYGQFVNKNHFAFLMEMAFGLALGIILAGRLSREKALIYFASLLPIWTGLVLSNSRGGILAMLAQLVVAALLFTTTLTNVASEQPWVRIARSFQVRFVLAAVLVAGTFIGTVWVGGDRLVNSIEAMRDEFDRARTPIHEGASRNDIWKASWKMFQAHPLAGVGMGAYWVAITGYHDASGVLTPQEAHNDYLELLASGGLIGFALAVWFAFAVISRIRQNLRSPYPLRRAVCFAATLGIAGVAIHSLVDFGLHMFVNAFTFTALIAIATSKQSLRDGRGLGRLAN